MVIDHLFQACESKKKNKKKQSIMNVHYLQVMMENKNIHPIHTYIHTLY